MSKVNGREVQTIKRHPYIVAGVSFFVAPFLVLYRLAADVKDAKALTWGIVRTNAGEFFDFYQHWPRNVLSEIKKL